MTALIITAAIVLLIFLLLASSITAELEYDRVFKFKIKYLFFTIAKDPLSPREQKKKKRKAEKKKRREEKKAKRQGKHLAEKKHRPSAAGKINAPEAKEAEPHTSSEDEDKDKDKTKDRPEEKKEKKKSKVTPELIFGIWGKAKPHVKRLFKKIRVTGVYADITVGGEDAAKTAISYGVHCAAVNGLAAFLDGMITFKAEKIDIKADFALEKSEYYAKATVKLRLSTLLHSGLWGAAAVYGELKNITAASEDIGGAPQKAAYTNL